MNYDEKIKILTDKEKHLVSILEKEALQIKELLSRNKKFGEEVRDIGKEILKLLHERRKELNNLK